TLTAGQRGQPLLREVRSLDGGQCLSNLNALRRRRTTRRPPTPGQAEQDRITRPDGFTRCGAVILWHITDSIVIVPGPPTEHPQLSRRHRKQPEDHLKQRRLTRSVGTYHRNDSAGRDIERALGPDHSS